MSELVQRLRDSVTQCRALDRSQLLEEAAAEIERLREQSNQTGGDYRSVRLTGAEREAVERAASFADDAAGYCKNPANADAARKQAAALRGLLERLK